MISRGVPAAGEAVPIRREPELRQVHPAPAEPVRLEAAAPSPISRDADAPAPDYHLIHYRLAALERLSLLRDNGALSIEEFAAEKALVLRLPAEELELPSESILPPRGPSLLGRLFGWRILAAGTLAGLAFAAWSAPRDLAGLFDQAVRLIN